MYVIYCREYEPARSVILLHDTLADVACRYLRYDAITALRHAIRRHAAITLSHATPYAGLKLRQPSPLRHATTLIYHARVRRFAPPPLRYEPMLISHYLESLWLPFCRQPPGYARPRPLPPT